MNGEERQLITDLFDRMRGVGAVEKEREAEALINQSVRQIPDSAYLLVQSVLVQENALQMANGRIEELEERVRQLEQQAPRPAQQGSGGFLGGLWGGGAAARNPAPAGRSSVPAFGQGRPMGAPPAAGGGAWGSAPGYGQQPPQQQASGGGSFMKTAMMTAAGVAGGMLLASSISNMMKGDTASTAGGASSASNDPASSQQASNVGYDDADNDPGAVDTADDGGSWGGGDISGGDMDA